MLNHLLLDQSTSSPWDVLHLPIVWARPQGRALRCSLEFLWDSGSSPTKKSAAASKGHSQGQAEVGGNCRRNPAEELAVSHPAEHLPNTNLEEHTEHEKQILEVPLKAEGWVSCQLPQSSGPASLAAEAAQKQEVLAAPPALLQLHQLPITLSEPLGISCTSFISHSLSPQKIFLCKEDKPLFEPSPLGSCGSRCAGGEQTPPAGASPLPTCSQP